MVVKKGRITRNGQKFIVDPVQMIDMKDYQCTAKNGRDAEQIKTLGSLRVHGSKCLYTNI